jgi:hypothetical protein
MTPGHPRWGEFVDRLIAGLAGPEAAAPLLSDEAWSAVVRGCNSRYTDRPPFETTQAVLANMEMDVEASLDFFEDHGGRCDCTILLNVEAIVQERDA